MAKSEDLLVEFTVTQSQATLLRYLLGQQLTTVRSHLDAVDKMIEAGAKPRDLRDFLPTAPIADKDLLQFRTRLETTQAEINDWFTRVVQAIKCAKRIVRKPDEVLAMGVHPQTRQRPVSNPPHRVPAAVACADDPLVRRKRRRVST